MTDSQTPGAPAPSWSTLDPDLVQKRDPDLVCPAPPTAVSKKKLREEELIEPKIPRGEPDDSRNYGGPNVRLQVPGGGEDDKKRCASQKRTLCCKGPANLPRVVQNCWHCMFLFCSEQGGKKMANMGVDDVSNEVCEDYRNVYCCRRTDVRLSPFLSDITSLYQKLRRSSSFSNKRYFPKNLFHTVSLPHQGAQSHL